MYEYINYYKDRESESIGDLRLDILEKFFKTYSITNPADLYMWLWEGEFGYSSYRHHEEVLDKLSEDIRKSRIEMGSVKLPVWEYLGLNNKLLKINIVAYAASNCPLLRLIFFSSRTRDIKSNSLRFKKNWQFIKTQISPGMTVTVEEMIEFENSIPFHMTPEVRYTDSFLKQYGTTYRIVPSTLFFSNFPEFNPEDQGSGDFV